MTKTIGADGHCGDGEVFADEGDRSAGAGEADDGGEDDAEDAFADDEARGEEHAELLEGSRFEFAISVGVEPPADDRTSNHGGIVVKEALNYDSLSR